MLPSANFTHKLPAPSFSSPSTPLGSSLCPRNINAASTTSTLPWCKSQTLSQTLATSQTYYSHNQPHYSHTQSSSVHNPEWQEKLEKEKQENECLKSFKEQLNFLQPRNRQGANRNHRESRNYDGEGVDESGEGFIQYKNQIITLKTPEDIAKWREERKKNYPTKENVEKKKEEENQRRKEFNEKRKNNNSQRGSFNGRKRGRGRGKGRFEYNNRRDDARNNFDTFNRRDDNQGEQLNEKKSKNGDLTRDNEREGKDICKKDAIHQSSGMNSDLEDGEIVSDDEGIEKKETITTNTSEQNVHETDKTKCEDQVKTSFETSLPQVSKEMQVTSNPTCEQSHLPVATALTLLCGYDSESDEDANVDTENTSQFMEVDNIKEISTPSVVQPCNQSQNDSSKPDEIKSSLQSEKDAENSLIQHVNQKTKNEENEDNTVKRTIHTNKKANRRRPIQPRVNMRRKLTLFEKLLLSDINRQEDELINSLECIVNNNFLQDS